MSIKLALIGKNISHSLSPKLQGEIWGEKLEKYDLIDIKDEFDLPSLEELSKSYLGINITTPYKEHYLGQVKIDSALTEEIGAINTIFLKDMSAINSDVIAVEKILKSYLELLPQLKIHLLGNGVMARMTLLVAKKLNIPFKCYSRASHGDLTLLNLSSLEGNDLVVNSCSRSFVYRGEVSSQCHFWDYNYAFPEHEYLQEKVKTYQDGQELLWEQAKAAADFWRQKAKLNN